jgi:hypothetical protein
MKKKQTKQKNNNQNKENNKITIKNNNSVTVPVKLYSNSDTSKAQILSENKNKSGIYM